eukprot:gene18084-biopygen18657
MQVKMETMKKLRRLAEPGDWCCGFNLQDGFHARGINPNFQHFMQFDLQGEYIVPWKYFAVPVARLNLRELYFVLASKREWGAKVKLCRTLGGHRVVGQTAGDEPVEQTQDREVYGTGTKAHGRVFAWTRPAEACGTCVPERELEVKVVRLYYDNQAVVAMLSQITSRNPDLMQQMRCLWSPLDLHGNNLQAKYVCSEAEVWADELSRSEDLDNWRLNRRCMERLVLRGGDLAGARLVWRDQLGESALGVTGQGGAEVAKRGSWMEALAMEVVIMPRRWDFFTPSRLGGSELLGPSKWGAVMFSIPSSWRPSDFVATVDCTEPHDKLSNNATGDKNLELVTNTFILTGEIMWERDTAIPEATGVNMTELSTAVSNITGVLGDGAVRGFPPPSALWKGRKSEQGEPGHTELAAQMQRSALQGSTKSNCGPQVLRSVQFCAWEQRRPWLPASEATGGAVTRALKGKASSQAEQALEEERSLALGEGVRLRRTGRCNRLSKAPWEVSVAKTKLQLGTAPSGAALVHRGPSRLPTECAEQVRALAGPPLGARAEQVRALAGPPLGARAEQVRALAGPPLGARAEQVRALAGPPLGERGHKRTKPAAALNRPGKWEVVTEAW